MYSNMQPVLLILITLISSETVYGQGQPNRGNDLNELIILLDYGPGVDSPEGFVRAMYRRAYAGHKQALGDPLGARLALTRRATGELRKWLQHNPDSPRARLERYVVLSYPQGANLDRIQEVLERHPHVLHVERNFRFDFSARIPNDPLLPPLPISPVDPQSGQWAIEALNLPEAWEVAVGHGYVGIIDLGLDVDHPDLRAFGTFSEDEVKDVCSYGPGSFEGGNFRPQFSKDFVNGDCNVDELDDIENPGPNTFVGHGSHVAGIVAATANNGIGVAGGCWNCSLMMAKGVGKNEAADALTWLVDKGAQTINMSFGKAGIECPNDFFFSPMFCCALELAQDRDVLLVAAPGNDKSDIEFPASDPRVISAGGIELGGALWDREDEAPGLCPCDGGLPPDVAAFLGCSSEPRTWECGSNFTFTPGASMQDLVAPAKNVLSTMVAGFEHDELLGCGDSTHPSDGYGFCTGTSMSSPHVTAVGGILRSVNPLLTKAEIRDSLTKNADRANDPDSKFGYGVPDAAASVYAALGTAAGRPLPNRLTPLFSLYSPNDPGTPGAGAHLYTTVPQMASAALFDSEVAYSTFIQRPLRPPVVPGYLSFPGAPCTIGPCLNQPRASVYVFTTESAPFSGTPPLAPLYRMSFQGTWRDNPLNRSFAYATDVQELELFAQVGYQLDGIEGYVYERCQPEPSCIPDGAVRLYRLYHFARDDYAIFPETEHQSFLDDNYQSQSGLRTWIGYVYPNLDTDHDQLIDGFENLIGTDPNAVDSDCDGRLDGPETADYPYDDPLIGPCAMPQQVWIDFAYLGQELGTFSQPFNTLAEGVDAVAPGGLIAVKAGRTPETPTLSKPVTIEAYGGTALIGN